MVDGEQGFSLRDFVYGPVAWATVYPQQFKRAVTASLISVAVIGALGLGSAAYHNYKEQQAHAAATRQAGQATAVAMAATRSLEETAAAEHYQATQSAHATIVRATQQALDATSTANAEKWLAVTATAQYEATMREATRQAESVAATATVEAHLAPTREAVRPVMAEYELKKKDALAQRQKGVIMFTDDTMYNLDQIINTSFAAGDGEGVKAAYQRFSAMVMDPGTKVVRTWTSLRTEFHSSNANDKLHTFQSGAFFDQKGTSDNSDNTPIVYMPNPMGGQIINHIYWDDFVPDQTINSVLYKTGNGSYVLDLVTPHGTIYLDCGNVSIEELRMPLSTIVSQVQAGRNPAGGN